MAFNKIYNKAAERFKDSLINNILNKITLFLRNKAAESQTVNKLTTYGAGWHLIGNSLAYKAYNASIGKGGNGFSGFIKKNIEDSKIISWLQSLNKWLLGMKLSAYGFFLLISTAISCILYFTEEFIISDIKSKSDSVVFNIFIFAALLLISLLFLLSKKRMGEALTSSCFIKWFMINALDIRKEKINEISEINTKSGIWPLILGVLCALLSYYINIVLVLAALIAAVFIALVMSRPENGIVAIIFVLPFLYYRPSMIMAGLVILTAVSFIFKVMMGRRVVHAEFFDLLIMMFAFLMLYGGFIAPDRSESLQQTAMYVCFISIFFLIVNLIKTRELITKLISAMLISADFVCIYGLYQAVFGAPQMGAWIDSGAFGFLNRIYSTFDNPNVLGLYLVAVIPFALAFYIRGNTKGLRKLGGVTLLLTAVCIILTLSRGALIGAFLAVSFVMIIHSAGYLKALILGIIAVPFTVALMPSFAVIERITSIGSLEDTSTKYRISIWTACFNMIKDYWMSGIGVGTDAFMTIYPHYALSGAAFALHSHNLYLNIVIELGIVGAVLFAVIIFKFFQMSLTGYKHLEDRQSRYIMLAAAGSMIGILFFGITDSVWYNYRIFMLFWIVIGLSALTARSSAHEWRSVAG